MLTEVAGYYNGTSVILDEPIDIPFGQKVLVTILGTAVQPEKAVQPKKNIDLSKYMGRGKKMMTEDAQDYVNRLRANDRI